MLSWPNQVNHLRCGMSRERASCFLVYQPGERSLVFRPARLGHINTSVTNMERKFRRTILGCVDRGAGCHGAVSEAGHLLLPGTCEESEEGRNPGRSSWVRFGSGRSFRKGAGIIERAIIREIELAFSVQLHRDKLVEVTWETRIRLRGANSLVGVPTVPPSEVRKST